MAFVVGYLVGANAGEEGLRELSESIQTIRQAEELTALIAAVRSHAGASLKQAAAVVEPGHGERLNASQVVERVRDLIDRAGVDRFRPAPAER
jgi:hypothetical protein